jgi:hypothetical protein
LKAINFQGIFWFGWPSTIAVFTTPFWLAIGGLMLIIVAIILAAIFDYDTSSGFKLHHKEKK